jgi:N-acetylglucosaminyldiphosphoundecaprenol N-acetyl-beta-D-mannosaminyltransferase
LRSIEPAKSRSGWTAVLGVPISLVDLSTAATRLVDWTKENDREHLIFARDVASLVLAANESALLELHKRANLVVPDGTPLVWVSRLRGLGAHIGRVPGADLVDEVCKRSLSLGLSHFFYGGKPDVAKKMADALSRRYPGLRVAGVWSPPMREIGPDFDPVRICPEELRLIRDSNADFVWVGLSSPKQEYWIAKAAPLVRRGVFVGVGAAFDFHAGAVRRAPPWMRDNGLEWLHRLFSEPGRLWRRYLVLAPIFVLRATLELAREARLGRS